MADRQFWLRPYTWRDHETRTETHGVQIVSKRDGRQFYTFVPDSEVYELTQDLADYIDGMSV